MDINEWAAHELNKTQNDFGFKKKVPVTTTPEILASFLLITQARPAVAGLVGRVPLHHGGTSLVTPFF